MLLYEVIHPSIHSNTYVMDISERMLGYNHQKLENKECLYPQKASSTVEETSDGMKCDNAGKERVLWKLLGRDLD